MAPIEPTFRPTRADDYLRPGGAWDVGALDDLLRHEGPAEALVDGALRVTGGELTERVGRLSAGLRGSGVRCGDVVTFQLPNWHEAVLVYRACWHVGAIAAPVHVRAGSAELASMVAALSPALHVTGGERPPAPDTPTIRARDDGSFERLLEADDQVDRDGESPEVAVVLFTAGTSGTPKAVLHTHHTLGSKAVGMVGVHGLTNDDTVLMPAPLAHVSGLLNGILVPQVAGMKTVLMERWDAASALKLIEQEQVTFMVGPPTFFTDLMGHRGFTPERVSSLRLVSTGGAGVSEAFAAEASQRLGCVVKRTYGSTEAPSVATTPAGEHGSPRAWVCDGQPINEAELRVVDPDDDAQLPAGREGELWVRAPAMFAGYLDPAATAAAVVDGWFRTGDLARIDEDGWLTVVGRATDVIIRGGENISPTEVAAVLEEHPDVDEAVVIGYPDERLGERIAAFVVATDFNQEICRAWFESRGLARFKWPEHVEVLETIPRLPAGKPDVNELRRLL